MILIIILLTGAIFLLTSSQATNLKWTILIIWILDLTGVWKMDLCRAFKWSIIQPMIIIVDLFLNGIKMATTMASVFTPISYSNKIWISVKIGKAFIGASGILNVSRVQIIGWMDEQNLYKGLCTGVLKILKKKKKFDPILRCKRETLLELNVNF